MDLTDKDEIIKLYYLYGEELYKYTDTNKAIVKEIADRQDKLYNSLTEEQQNEYNKIDELITQSYEETDKAIFVSGFTMAVKLIMQSLK